MDGRPGDAKNFFDVLTSLIVLVYDLISSSPLLLGALGVLNMATRTST